MDQSLNKGTVKTIRVPAAVVRRQIVAVLTSWGMDEGLVETTADIMVETDLMGVDSHGVSMLMDYAASRAKGKLNVKAKPRIVRESPVMARIDADAGLGHPASVLGMRTAIDKAKITGLAAVTVFNSHHFGAAGCYAAMAAREGLIGLVTSATRTINVVPTRGRAPVLGTNPIAVGAPAAGNKPFLLDMATSTTASNKVKVYDLNGKTLPPGWVIDENGSPITDAALAMDYIKNRDVGGLSPVGGTAEMASYKGYGLGVVAHILGGALSGASFSPLRVLTQRTQDPDDLGHFFLAIDPKAFREEGEFEHDLGAAMDVLHATPPADPALPVLVAGDPQYAMQEERERLGIPVPVTLVEKIRAVCDESKAEFVMEEPK